MKQKTIRTDPLLWEMCKKEVVEKLGKFSARAMQQAVVLYKSRGGGYIGDKSVSNSLISWQKEEDQKQGIK